MKTILLFIAISCSFHAGICQTRFFDKKTLIDMKERELSGRGYKEITVHYYFCGLPVSEKAMIGVANNRQNLQIVLTLSVPTLMDMSGSPFVPAQYGYVERNKSYTNSNAIHKIETQYKYRAIINNRAFYFDL